MNKNLIRLEDLPEEIQEKIQQHLDEQHQFELYKQQIEQTKELAKTNPGTTIIINNHNTYNTNFLRNDGTINEKQDSIVDIFTRTAGKAAGKTWKWLNTPQDSK